MGSINYITTIIMLRRPGMKMFRMPMTVWALFITALLQAFALPVLTAALVMQLLDRTAGTNFFQPVQLVGGQRARRSSAAARPLMWQHLFWFYSHPAVYIMILPAMGFVSDIISTFSRKPLFGYKPMVFAIAGIAGLGLHRLGAPHVPVGHEPRARGDVHALDDDDRPALGRSRSSTGWGRCGAAGSSTPRRCSTRWRSWRCSSSAACRGSSWRPRRSTCTSTTPTSSSAHIHYVLFGGSTFGIFAAIYYWFPKMFGRMMNERLGKIHFFLTFIFFNGTFFPMHIVGMHGMPAADRRPDGLPVPEQPGDHRDEPVHDLQRLRRWG